YWVEISSAMDFLRGTPSHTYIRDPVRRLCHRLISYNIFGRGQAHEKVTTIDLFYLRSMDRGAANVPYLLAQYLFGHAKGRKSGAREAAGAAIGAPKAAEDAPAVDERLGRLEEEIQGLRRDVRSLRGLVESLMTDQGRVSTWIISCMTQLIEVSGKTYQAFDGTFQGSSPAVFERCTRQRTGEASTSTALQQPDP
ncbi:hypothetical protein Tco_1210486, partial [Tanacetum coccineum]